MSDNTLGSFAVIYTTLHMIVMINMMLKIVASAVNIPAFTSKMLIALLDRNNLTIIVHQIYTSH